MKAVQWITMMLVLVLLCGCAAGTVKQPSKTEDVGTEDKAPTKSPSIPEEKQFNPTAMPQETDGPQSSELIGLVDTEEDAIALSELYGIEFLSFSHGVGLFATEEDPQTVIQRGRENGWPELSLNREKKLF